jgi:predicted DNA-binding WGR domain protein
MITSLPDVLDRPIRLEAVCRQRNIARRYIILASRDLFGSVIVEYGWGRIGTRGQRRTVSFTREDDAERFVRSRLRERASARRRIGVEYLMVP